VIVAIIHSKIVRTLVLIGFLAVAALSLYGVRWLHQPLTAAVNGPQLIEIIDGDSLYRVGHRYGGELGLTHVRFWVWYARLYNLTDIQRGEYELPRELTPVSLLRLLNSGQVKQRTISLIEGTTLKEALSVLEQIPTLSEGEPLTPAAVRQKLQIEQENPEGWLFPDTYAYTKQTTAWQLLEQSHKKLKRVLAQEWEGRAENLPYETPYEALIMASIVEKETGVPHERAEIAGVFVRRLQQGMRLQTDPTIIYGLGDSYQGDIKRKHLRQRTPYNTYVINGLPPTPIALAGREAIHAALHPADGSSLYFVAKGDGSHQFSATLSQHQAAVKQFQLNRKADYRSTQ
tara:strand:- start:23968 stop:25002 length:1035 start_codon:yes stop_codon:yes gene_type:complete